LRVESVVKGELFKSPVRGYWMTDALRSKIAAAFAY
jgi:hypothetical protein